MNRIFTTWKFTLNVCLPAPHPHLCHLKKETTKIWASGPGIMNKSTFGLDWGKGLRLGEGSLATTRKSLVSGHRVQRELSAFTKASENLHVTVL